MIIDSHCHLTYEPMSLKIDETINQANKEGVKFILTISTEDKSYDKILNIISNHKCVYGTYGIHPHEAKNHRTLKFNKILERVNLNKKIIGIGETGLDFYYNHSAKAEQIKCFEEHIEAAQNTNKPIIFCLKLLPGHVVTVLKSHQ